MGWTQKASFQPDQKPRCFGFLPALVSLLCLMDEAQAPALQSNLCHLRQIVCLLWVTTASEEHLAHDENLPVHSSLSWLQMPWVSFKKFPYDISHLQSCENAIHMASKLLQAEFGTVPNRIAVSLLSGGHRGRGGWAAWAERTVPFLKHVEQNIYVHSVYYFREVSLSHTIGIAFGNLHMTRHPTFFLSLVPPEQGLCMLLFFNSILVFCFPSHFPSEEAWGLTYHHTEKQLILCSLSHSFLAEWRLM